MPVRSWNHASTMISVLCACILTQKPASSAIAVSASAYTVGNHMVFDDNRFDFDSHSGRRLLAHELTHVVQQSGRGMPRALSRAPAEADQKENNPVKKPKAPKCDTGCAQRWGRDTICSKWGFVESIRKKERAKNGSHSLVAIPGHYLLKLLRATSSESMEQPHAPPDTRRRLLQFRSARTKCRCSAPTQSPEMFGETAKAKDCQGSISTEVIEMSPKAMFDLSGKPPLHVTVCYSGSKQDLCLHDGPGAKKYPTIQQCLTLHAVEDTQVIRIRAGRENDGQSKLASI